jgi:hypothetical protein
MRPQYPQTPLTDEQRSFASSYEIARQQNAKNPDKAALMIELRKWCLLQAIAAFAEGAAPKTLSLADLSEDILKFVTAPLQE